MMHTQLYIFNIIVKKIQIVSEDRGGAFDIFKTSKKSKKLSPK